MGAGNISVQAFLIKRGDFSGASDICDFLSHIGEQQQLFKEGECNSPLQ
jgi:hypothetical protein